MFGYILYTVILLDRLRTPDAQSNSGKDIDTSFNDTNIEYLRYKWELWYKFDDVNHKRGITIEDVKLSVSEFVRTSNLTGDRGKNVSAAMEEWWKENILSPGKDRLTMEQFVNRMEDQFKTNKTAFVKWNADAAFAMYSLYDVNGDGALAIEEYIFLLNSLGHTNSTNFNDLFDTMNGDDDKLSINNMVQYWVVFATCDDPDKDDPTKYSFEQELNISINK